ncbi:hypothetical protein LAZ67_13001274 [Cordylochernes scorpioides]|uniref:Transmembrane protein n=1 Tax=Cordylochernes scorpioides TaxID=51811 RepID=A0ABY6L6D1_9ARAC|nr:hypothetical protein LAZ67_13001274 [Cordylochernes scorpioides]
MNSTIKRCVSVRQEMTADPEFLNFGLWLVVVLSVALAMVFSLVAAVFAVINTVMTPVEVITGLAGLYLWNVIGIHVVLAMIIMPPRCDEVKCLVSVLLAWVGSGCWLGQFLSRLQNNVMSKEEQDQHWSSTGRAVLGYSFWLVVAAGFLMGLNLALVRLASRPPSRSRPQLAGSKHPEGAIMLY